MKTKELATDKATPRPWKVTNKGALGMARIIPADGNEFFTIAATSGFNTAEAEANAELITRAVNSFEAMREALKLAQEDHGRDGFKISSVAFVAIHRALLLAEGKAVQS